MSIFVLSAFGDEIAPELAEQVAHLKSIGVNYLEFRSAWGKNVKDLDADELARARKICDDHQIAVSAIGSPVGKTPIHDLLENEVAVLQHVFKACDALGTRRIRIFSFYPPMDCNPADFLAESIERLSHLTSLAAREGCTLLLENDEELVGSTIEMLYGILSKINHPNLRYAWDGANFVRSGVSNPTSDGWEKLSPFIGTVHVKDARQDRSQRAAGDGDAQISDLFQKLHETDYQGFLAIEPHPYHVDGRGELRGAEGMTYAVEAARKLLADLNLSDAPAL